MNESATKAAQTAELLCQDLRELHKRCLAADSTTWTRMAEAHALALFNQAKALHHALKGIAP